MQQGHRLIWNEQTLWLSPERLLFWEEQQTLVVSDIHFGKSGHFRKEGIAIPQEVFREDLRRLFTQVHFYRAHRLLITGDFFHSRMNREAELFEKWRRDHSLLTIHLVQGNHDILPAEWFQEQNIELHTYQYKQGPFRFVHEWDGTDAADENPFYTFSGHLHPGIRIEGVGKQSLRFPCFYFSKHYAVLPAFGRFTGLHLVKPGRADRVFAIADRQVLEMPVGNSRTMRK
ncbi:MAG TPA: ligase-associated DNA damage response endonuclease PdeM [Lacibacter sp.]|nr:ligase-associated DNA damage response endonuclease PdeM [Lacibacter sp.]HMO89263.1 ligase-associated DNA damage response endonuclease PdeM [Lacibacter sp.]HMP87319.1 ligase-associated DNA damage response endonuclease PdeM [Lacibacter sp.]